MTVFAIAALHCLFPMFGALIGKNKGLVVGTAIGVVLAPILGSIVFTIPDLIGVAVGYLIGKGMVGSDSEGTDFSGVMIAISDFIEKIAIFLKRGVVIAFWGGLIGFMGYTYLHISHEQNVRIEKEQAEREKFDNTPKEEFERACYEWQDGEACWKYAYKFPLDSDPFLDALKKGCTLGNDDACINLPFRLFLLGRFKETIEWIPELCERGETHCIQLGYFVKHDKDRSVGELEVGIKVFEEAVRRYPDAKYVEDYRECVLEFRREKARY